MQEGGDRARPQGAGGPGGERSRRVQGRGREGQGGTRVELSFELRPPRPDDAAAIAAVVNELSQSLYGEPDVAADEVRQWFDLPDVDALVAELEDGRLAGYVDLTPQAGQTRFWIDLRVRPGDAGAAIADALLAAIEARAAEIAAPGAILESSTPSGYELAAASLEARGYEVRRHSFQMRIDLERELDAPRWPPGITLRQFRPGRDDRAVYETQQETFADQFEYVRQSYEEWRAYAFIGRHDPSLWFIAEDGSRIAGICLCRPEWAGDPRLGWVSVLGVRGPWRRRGLALALLLHSFAELRSRGKARVGLGVDGLNPTGAVGLYERAGMRVVRRSDRFRKPLRP